MPTGYDTDAWPVIRARHFTSTTGRNVRVIVLHTMEAPEKGTTAEAVARYFQRGTVKASAHICVDNDSIVQCVFDRDVAYAAPGCNADGIQIEMAGYARQTPEQWDDAYSRDLLARVADAVAQYCLKYSIPVVHLSDKELKNPKNKGIIGHDQVSRVYKKSSHTDPGKYFPWQEFMQMTMAAFTKRKAAKVTA